MLRHNPREVRDMRRILFMLAPWIWLLAGCASDKIATAKVPVAVGCIEMIPMQPVFADNAAAIRAARNIEERARLLIAGRIQRDGHIDKLSSILEGCKLPVF